MTETALGRRAAPRSRLSALGISSLILVLLPFAIVGLVFAIGIDKVGATGSDLILAVWIASLVVGIATVALRSGGWRYAGVAAVAFPVLEFVGFIAFLVWFATHVHM